MELEIRAWDKSLQKMFYLEGATISEIVSWAKECVDGFWFEDGEDVWLQYIGFKDKNNKKVFEGDIVKVRYRIDDGHGGYYLDDKYTIWKVNIPSCYTTPFDMSDAEVIGNVYENLELLDKERING